MTVDVALLQIVVDNATPRPQGSMLTMKHSTTGQPIIVHAKGIVEYRSHVAGMFGQHWIGAAHDQPVRVVATFGFPRPAAHYLPANSRRAEPALRTDAPTYPVGRFIPDLDKLQRLIGDALQLGGVLADDALIVSWAASKVWTEKHLGWTVVTMTSAH